MQRSCSWKYPFPHEVTHCPFLISRAARHEEHSNPLVQAEHVSSQASKSKERAERRINLTRLDSPAGGICLGGLRTCVFPRLHLRGVQNPSQKLPTQVPPSW